MGLVLFDNIPKIKRNIAALSKKFQKTSLSMALDQDSSPLTINASDDLSPALRAIADGGVIAFPTETFYGLGVDPFNEAALERLFVLKGRARGKPLPLIAGDMDSVRAASSRISTIGEKLIKKFWPGPLTLILSARPGLPELVRGDSDGLGIRISPHPLCLRLLNALGRPLTATSANPTGRPPALDAAEVEAYFNGKVDIIIDGGRLAGGPPSTVVDARGKEPLILREGAVRKEDILKAIGWQD